MVLHWRGYRIKHLIELKCNLIAGIENFHEETFINRPIFQPEIDPQFCYSTMNNPLTQKSCPLYSNLTGHYTN
jgi:hypothetical protein